MKIEHPLGRAMAGACHRGPSAADPAAWLLSDRASFVTGQSIAVDGGWTSH